MNEKVKMFNIVTTVLDMQDKKKKKELPPSWLCKKYMVIYQKYGFDRFLIDDVKEFLGESSSSVVLRYMMKYKLIRNPFGLRNKKDKRKRVYCLSK